MGWYTQINIIVENVQNKEQEIANALFQTDAKTYWHNEIFYAKYRQVEGNKKVLFFTYERRKYLPYWTIQDVSNNYLEIDFTVIASSPEYVGGPCGLVRIKNGIITDSYGFWERGIDTIQAPTAETMYQLFGIGKLEEQIRELYLELQHRKWIEERYFDNIIDFNEEQMFEFDKIIETTNSSDDNWIEIKLI